MKKIGRIGAEILEQLNDNKVHKRANMLQHQKALLRGDEETYINK